MITVSNVSKRFRLYSSPADRLKEIVLRRSFHTDFTALNNVSFTVQPGETLGIIGQNGAGKSTLLKILTGVLIPDTGSVHIQGRITGLLELGTGFNPEFSGLDNIFLNGSYLGLSRKEIKDRLDLIVEFTELGDFIQEPLKTYSSGMVMRLAFSIAIHADPSAFVIDEALSVGDAYFQQKCMQKIKEFKHNGGSIVFVSHDMNSVKILCDQAILLEQGECIEMGTPEEIVNSYNYIIARRKGGEEIDLHRPDKGGSIGYGNDKVLVTDVSLLNDEDNEINIALTGAQVKLQIQLTASENLDDVTVGVIIRDKFGQDIFGTNTYHLAAPIKVKKGCSYTVVYQFDEFNIGPGKYTVTVATHSSDTHLEDCYNWVDKAFIFEVVGDIEYVFVGIIRMKPTVNVTCVE